MEDGREGSEKQAVAAKKLATRSGSKDAADARARSRPTPVRGHRRWSSSTDLDIIETAPVVTPPPTPRPGGSAAASSAAVLGRSFSTTAAISVAVDGGVNHQQAAPEGEEAEEGEQRPRRRCGAGARLSRKIKEHRARFYIIRRCVAMLVCWRDADD